MKKSPTKNKKPNKRISNLAPQISKKPNKNLVSLYPASNPYDHQPNAMKEPPAYDHFGICE